MSLYQQFNKVTKTSILLIHLFPLAFLQLMKWSRNDFQIRTNISPLASIRKQIITNPCWQPLELPFQNTIFLQHCFKNSILEAHYPQQWFSARFVGVCFICGFDQQQENISGHLGGLEWSNSSPDLWRTTAMESQH